MIVTWQVWGVYRLDDSPSDDSPMYLVAKMTSVGRPEEAHSMRPVIGFICPMIVSQSAPDLEAAWCVAWIVASAWLGWAHCHVGFKAAVRGRKSI